MTDQPTARDAMSSHLGARALRSASIQMLEGVATGSLPFGVRSTVANWLETLATGVERRADAPGIRDAARQAAGQQPQCTSTCPDPTARARCVLPARHAEPHRDDKFQWWPAAECAQCGDTGACNGGPCAHPAAGLDASQPATDLPDRLAAILTERYTEHGNPFSGMRTSIPSPDGWPASRQVSPRDVATVLRELLTAADTEKDETR